MMFLKGRLSRPPFLFGLAGAGLHPGPRSLAGYWPVRILAQPTSPEWRIGLWCIMPMVSGRCLTKREKRMEQTKAILRLADLSDVVAVAALTEQAYAAYTHLLGAPPIPVTEDYRPRVEAEQVWLLELSGKLAGLIVLERHIDHILIFSVAIAPEFQGKKLGIRLLDWAEEKAAEAGVDLVKLYTNARMERNIALYSAYGYRETGRRANPKRPGWTVVDMEKRLTSQG